ncbi:HlyD family efflux transporter periplasmic adaptor subunit [Rhodobacteraceae bacterium GS-10]|uniref:HlyD family efflux transporter periplasmic adaptor subunit n=2 Tax=Thalassovita mangrovi TaxID=2692236 RepID=A0A6L8LQT8_9RHOB|nr:HlyD family efflux transporter periplasmic adaptor subunit [Thalassovita mangrovi]
MNADAKKPGEHTAPSDSGQKARKGHGRRRLLMAMLPAVLLLSGGGYWVTGGRYVETDNAYIHQPMISISPDVSGRITGVSVGENQTIEKGAALFEIDPTPYRIALDRAEATLAAARLSVAQLRAAHATAKAQLEAARNILDVQQRELERQQELTARGVGSMAKLDQSKVTMLSARNAVEIAQRQLDAAATALNGDPEIETDAMPSVRAAIAARDAAARDLEKTTVRATSFGTVSQIESLNVGQFLAAGSTATTLVDTSQSWVEANFKETQLDGLAVGQPVDIGVDAYPGVTLHGRVESFGSATGSQFSLIPAQNATGNWVKVVQRVPVRIRIDGAPEKPLRDGMSVSVAVDTGHSRLDAFR